MSVDCAPTSERSRRTNFVLRRGRSLCAYFTTFVVSIAGAVWVHRINPSDLSRPWRVKDSDLSSVYSLTQALGQSWTGLEHRALGAPYTADLALAFIPDDLHLLVLRILMHSTHSAFVSVNLFYLLTFGLSGISFQFLCRKLGCSRFVAVALSVSYSWLPYHFSRMDDGHVFLAAYYMVPIGVLVIVRLIQFLRSESRKPVFETRLSLACSALAVVAVGSSGAYYGLFFSLLALSTLALIPRKGRRLADVIQSATLTCLLAVGFISAPILRNLWARAHGLESHLARSPSESLQFGGQIARLFVPWGVWIPDSLRPIVTRQEFEWLAVPLLAIAGIWVLTLGLVRRSIESNRLSYSVEVGALQFIFFWSLLFFSAGGFGLVFAYGIDPSFRTWNRFAIIIMTIALACISILLSEALKNTKKIVRVLTSILVLTVAFATQLRPVISAGIGVEPDRSATRQFEDLRRVADRFKASVPEGCKILQLPTMAFPEGGRLLEVGNGDHLWIPLLAPQYHFSYGAPKWSQAGKFWLTFNSVEALKKAEDLGFCGALINSKGIENSELDQLKAPISIKLGFGYRLILFQPLVVPKGQGKR